MRERFDKATCNFTLMFPYLFICVKKDDRKLDLDACTLIRFEEGV